MENFKRLHRSQKDKILGGVCGGIGEYFGIDPVIIRLLWVILFLIGGWGALAYLIAWIIIPIEKSNSCTCGCGCKEEPKEPETKPEEPKE